MSYQDEATELADTVAEGVLAALAAHVAGQISADVLVSVVAAYLAAGTNGAAALGDVALAAAVTVATGTPAGPLGITRPADDPERLARAARTILADLKPDDEASLSRAQMRYQRLVEAEIRQAVADAYDEAVSTSKAVTGWRRGLEPDACQLCRWWARDGRVWPADYPIQRHPGCDCSQLITTNTEPIRQPYANSRRTA